MKRLIVLCAALAFATWQLTSSEAEAVRYGLLLFPLFAAVLIGCLARI